MRAVLALGIGFVLAADLRAADPPATKLAPAPAPTVAAAPQVVQAVPSQPCDCGQSNGRRAWKPWRPQRLWLTADRPIIVDEDKFRYEPRIRDIRFAPMSSTLPGGAMFGAPDTLPVIPTYRDGYLRVFSFR